MSRFLLAAPSSGSGKTTLTLGLLRAMANRGLRVQPFKCGPDYIDTRHHSTAAGTPSINLDLFMASAQHVSETFYRFSEQADVAVVEGVMGLFDGADKMQGSSAALAELLDTPVVLVVNAKAMAYSAAPLLYGFKHFYQGINLIGVLFNFVNTPSHYHFLKEACEDVGVEALGYLPSSSDFSIPSRHLGLHISAETNYEAIIQTIADAIPQTIDLDRLLEITRTESSSIPPVPRLMVSSRSSLKIAVARDEAFAFTYQQNIDALAQLGTLTFFSPIRDISMPETDFLYLPGGYPELYAEALSHNQSMRDSIRNYCETGGLTYAECGGLMYLGQAIQTSSGAWFPMAGVLDITTSMLLPKLTLGYRRIDWQGMRLKGHEFHYSVLHDPNKSESITSVTNAKGIPVETKVYRTKNTFASYLHLYWAEQPAFIQALLNWINPVATQPKLAQYHD